MVVNRIHDLGHAMPFGLRREVAHKKSDAGRTHDRHQDDEWPPGVRRRMDVGVAHERPLTQEEEVVEQADQTAEHDRAQCADHAHHHGPPAETERAELSCPRSAASKHEQPPGLACRAQAGCAIPS